MKIGLFNTESGNGGAAIACRRLYKGLQKQGRDVSFVYTDTQSFSGKWVRNAAMALEKQKITRIIQKREDLFQFSSGLTGNPFIGKRLKEFDLINLHYITQGFLSLARLEELSRRGTPVVWTLHDMWAFTGGCHYAYDCNHYTQHCGNCFYLKNPGGGDYSAYIHRRKEHFFHKLNLVVVTPSRWLGEQASESSLFRDKEVRVIANPLSGDIHKPGNKDMLRRELGLPTGKKIILFGAANINDSRKGMHYLLQSLEYLKQKNPQSIQEMALVIFGKAREEGSYSGFESIYTGFISDEQLMARYYAAADVFVLPSLAENLPNSLVESLACGTPVTGFDAGGIPDIILHRQNGYLARYKDAADLAQGIQYVLNPQHHAQLSQQARQVFLERFEEKIQVSKYAALYDSML